MNWRGTHQEFFSNIANAITIRCDETDKQTAKHLQTIANFIGEVQKALMKEISSERETDGNNAQGVGAILGAIADLKHDNKLLRVENASLREANAANSQRIDDLAAMIGRLERHDQSLRPRPQNGWALAATPRATPATTPHRVWGPSRGGTR